ncbi:unnamed protein product [Sphenostylis stenocarpa]|uniref:Uncharacterized protein n=1 Tax=Sphenostylis stenocarpa TaxID=92480 RepID=A0AA87B8W1_9FABA|nr:unnamed protein product [Sphenostylis stenocarpa]
MKVLNFIFALILLAVMVHVETTLAGRVLNMKEQLSLMSIDDKGPVPPSGPSTCTYIPGTGGTNCPPAKEMNIVAENTQHHSHGTTFPRLVVQFGDLRDLISEEGIQHQLDKRVSILCELKWSTLLAEVRSILLEAFLALAMAARVSSKKSDSWYLLGTCTLRLITTLQYRLCNLFGTRVTSRFNCDGDVGEIRLTLCTYPTFLCQMQDLTNFFFSCFHGKLGYLDTYSITHRNRKPKGTSHTINRLKDMVANINTHPYCDTSSINSVKSSAEVLTNTMKVLNFILALILFVAVVHVEPNLASRVLKMKERVSLVSLDNKGPVPPSGPSTCTYIPGTGGKNCPPVEEIMNVEENTRHHSAETETYRRLVVPSGVATNQH